MRGLARLGIVALVDEQLATRKSESNGSQKILEKYVTDEWRNGRARFQTNSISSFSG